MSRYASGEYFSQYRERLAAEKRESARVVCSRRDRFAHARNVAQLRDDVMRHGIYNQNLQKAVPPTGSISISITPRRAFTRLCRKFEIRKEGNWARIYYRPIYDQ